MSKKQHDQIETVEITYNERVAYTDGFRAAGEKRSKKDTAFPAGTRLGDLWLQGYKDGKRKKKNEAYFMTTMYAQDNE